MARAGGPGRHGRIEPVTATKPLTTGEIAKLCGVNLRTVARWIERGHLKAYQLPGRGDNRVEPADFLDFLRRNAMPVPAELRAERKALVVEDDADVAEAMARTLREVGFEVQVATDGFQAGTLLGTFRPGLMTVDLRMAGMSGAEVIRQVRANPGLAGLRILIVSAMSEAEVDEALKAGADDVLRKPFEAGALAEKVGRLVGG